MRLPNELTHVHHARARHVGEAGVADVRVVLPHDRLRVRVELLVVRHEAVERVHHMMVADVPRRGASADHGAIVQLGVLCDERVLFGVEERLAAVLSVLRRAAPQRAQHGHRFVLARRWHEVGSTSVLLLVLPVRLEASIGALRVRRELWIDVLQIVDDSAHRIPE